MTSSHIELANKGQCFLRGLDHYDRRTRLVEPYEKIHRSSPNVMTNAKIQMRSCSDPVMWELLSRKPHRCIGLHCVFGN